MSSTSSSEYESDEYCQYEQGYDKNYRNAYGQNPFYPTMGHPLIYYTQVPQPISMKRRGRKRQRDSPNCFVKAFRWYTEEHVPNRNMSSNKPDMTAFVAWLDAKYDEFLHECTVDSDVFRVKVQQTSVIEAERTSKNAYCEPCSPRRFLRVKSPWKRKRRAKSNEMRDLRQPSNQSFQYILQPKDMSRLPSECCHPRSTITVASEYAKKGGCVKSRSFSNTTIVKNNEPAHITLIQEEIKSKTTQDFACQYCEAKPVRVDTGTQYDARDSAVTLASACPSEKFNECFSPLPKITIPINEVANVITSERPKQINDCPCDGVFQSLDRIPRKPTCRGAHENITMDVQVKAGSKEHKNTCSEKNIERVDIQTQYEDARPVKTFHTTCCECDLKEYVQSYPSPVQSTSKVHPCPCERNTKNEWGTEKNNIAVKLSQKTAQTSNHSICLGKEPVHVYPLFMKIVCADKLSDENDK